MLYQLDQNVVPNWFGVAIPDGITDFSRPTLYFHPSPSGAGYKDGPNDSIYFGKSKDAASRSADENKWLELFAYVDRLGHQLAGSVQLNGASPNQVVIVPFMSSSALPTAGILPNNWLPILSDILADIRQTLTGVAEPLTVSELVIAGFSFGYSGANAFRTSSKQDQSLLGPRLKQIWDFDGFPKTVSNPLVTVSGKFRAIKYSEGTEQQSLALPKPRWSDYPSPPPSEEPALRDTDDTSLVHHLIRDFMFLDAAKQR